MTEIPRWVRAADAAAAASLVLALFVVLFGGFVLHLGPVPLRIHGPGRLAFLALSLVAIRHAAHPANPLHRRIVRGLRGGTEASAASIARTAIASRAAALVMGYLAVVTIGLAPASVGFQVSADPALD